ncbi:sensor histidine kinase [Simplicispira psychrophila]|uniref:sensor histidine kinase n=1 Tax=Simplicispira psychrophila TaxID=80882 RepID=UPI000A01F071|nr:7TM-DISM domain-containing protein [Simplicispira psychrophila]
MPRTAHAPLTRLLWWWALALVLFTAPSNAADAWSINDLAVLADPHGAQTIASVSQPARAAQFKPMPYGFSAGFTRTVHWLRFTLHAPPPNAKGEREVLLEIHPPYLDDLQIYLSQPQAGSAFEVRRAGDLLPHAAKEFPHRAFVLAVDFADARPRTVYVRLHTTSSSVLAVKAWHPKDFAEHTACEYALLGVLFGLFFAGLLANLWQGLWRNEALHRRFIAYMGATLVNLSGVNGLAAEFLLPHSPFWASHWVSLGTLLVALFGVRFYMLALDIDHAPLWMRWVYRAQFWLALVCLPAPFLNLYPEAASVVLPFISLTLMTGTVRSVQLWRQENSTGKFLLAAHLFSLAGTLSVVPTLLGWLPGQLWLIYGFQLGPLATLLALQLMLTRRVQTMQNQLHQAALETERAQATAQQERTERDHQRHFLSMLTHELKTPLSVIRMRLGAKDPTARMQTYATQAVNDIDAIVERCALVSQIDDQAEIFQLQPCRIDELLSEVLAQQPAAQRVSLYLAPTASAAAVQSEPLLLRTVLGNLIDNALRYSPPDSTVQMDVELSTQDARAGVRIQIQNAVGVAGLPDPAQVFEKYYRSPGAHQQSGSGLGLYIVKALAEQLGASIVCRQDAGLIVFDLWLPMECAHADTTTGGGRPLGFA